MPTDARAKRINAEHEQCVAAVQQGLMHARAAGELLLQAKGRLRHGEWLPWLTAHCKVTARMAQRYMLVAERWRDLLAAHVDRSRVSCRAQRRRRARS